MLIAYGDIKREVMKLLFITELLQNARILINPTGRFVDRWAYGRYELNWP